MKRNFSLLWYFIILFNKMVNLGSFNFEFLSGDFDNNEIKNWKVYS